MLLSAPVLCHTRLFRRSLRERIEQRTKGKLSDTQQNPLPPDVAVVQTTKKEVVITQARAAAALWKI